jgi:hypothetical protein
LVSGERSVAGEGDVVPEFVGATEGVAETSGATGTADEGVGVTTRRGVKGPCGVIGAVSRAVGVAVIDGVDVGARLGIALGEARRNGVALCAIVADGPGI